MSDSSASPQRFQELGRRVSGRLHAISAMQWLNRTVFPVALVLILLIVANRLLALGLPEWGIVGGTLLAWALLVLLMNLVRPRHPYEALARWEKIMDTRSVLASAEFFEEQSERTVGQELHLERAQKLLDEREAQLTKDLPMPGPGAGWVTVLLLIGLLLMPSAMMPVLSFEEQIISEEMQERARAEAEALERQKAELADAEGLTEEEQAELEKLAEMLDSTAEMLAEGSSEMSAKELLEALEGRARDAEKLAESIGEDGEVWASEALIEALAEQPDTSDMADAIQDKESEQTAAEARELAQKMEDQNLTEEVQERLTAAFEKAREAATEEDTKRPVGKGVSDASTELSNEQPERAASELRALAEYFENVARREQAQEELKELAEQLRESGNNIAESQLEQMQELGSQGEGQEAPEGTQSLAEATPQMQQQPGQEGQQGQAQSMTAPGPQQNQQQQPGQQGQTLQAPVPGMAQQQQGEGQPQPSPGQGQEGQGPVPGMMAPVPGQQPEGGEQGGTMAGAVPGPSGNTAPGNGQQAGNATVEMGENATSTFEAAEDSMVAGSINESGESTMRNVQGGVRDEDAQRTVQQQVTDFIAVEEEALDEKALPVSRREQVQKYFTAIRENFEDE